MKKAWCLLMLVLAIIPMKAQTLSKNDGLRFDADFYMMEKEFSKARNNYLIILKSEPDNAEIKYRIGICYLNSEDEKGKAIPYLEEAVQKVSEKYNPNSFKETSAPVDAFFLLGSAYRLNKELDKAIEAYNRYKEYLDPKDDYNLEVTNQYISNCYLAREMLEKPVSMVAVNLGSPVNSEIPNYNAVISGDGKTMLFTAPGRLGYDIYYTIFADTTWIAPRIITSVLGTGKYMKTSDLSNDGQTLLLVLDDPMNSDIYVSHYAKSRWSKVEALGKEINSKSNETHASFSADGKTLYFTSDRKGGIGDLDIYRSELDEKGEWGKPVNLGPAVNTHLNEETPFVSDDGQQLYFSSEGHKGMGGYDIFRYDFNNPGAGVVNIGYPLNTTDNDLFFVPWGDATTAYYSFRGIDSYGGRDIYRVTVPETPVEEATAAIEEPAEAAITTAGDEEAAAAKAEAERMAAASAEAERMAAASAEAERIAAASAEAERIAAASAEAERMAAASAEAERMAAASAETKEEYTPVEDLPVKAIVTSTASLTGARSYTVQFMALRKPSDLTFFKGLSGITVTYGNDKWYRYTLGASTEISSVQKELEKLIGKGYHDAFIRGKTIIPKFTIQVMAVPGPVVDLTRFNNLTELSVTRGEDSFCRYTTGEYETKEEALADLEKVKALGYAEAFVSRVRIQQ